MARFCEVCGVAMHPEDRFRGSRGAQAQEAPKTKLNPDFPPTGDFAAALRDASKTVLCDLPEAAPEPDQTLLPAFDSLPSPVAAPRPESTEGTGRRRFLWIGAVLIVMGVALTAAYLYRLRPGVPPPEARAGAVPTDLAPPPEPVTNRASSPGLNAPITQTPLPPAAAAPATAVTPLPATARREVPRSVARIEHRSLFADVRVVIAGEVHAFAGHGRSGPLLAVVVRIRRLAQDVEATDWVARHPVGSS